tara:strand:- start:224 stop:445 length:222 start_codon:yes stop_codon:yes gene_type:complete
MLSQYIEVFETIGLNLFFAFIFIFIGLSIHDVMKTNNVPKKGRYVVYFVLFLGCFGFIVKGIIQLYMENQGIG